MEVCGGGREDYPEVVILKGLEEPKWVRRIRRRNLGWLSVSGAHIWGNLGPLSISFDEVV